MALIGNKCVEKDIREWLSSKGYYGNSAKVHELELHAIKPPGWLQVFRFTVETKSVQGEWTQLFGSVRDDERYNLLNIEAFPSRDQQRRQLNEWSQGMIRRQSTRSDEIVSVPMLAVFVFAFFGVVVTLLYLASLITG